MDSCKAYIRISLYLGFKFDISNRISVDIICYRAESNVANFSWILDG